MNAIELRYSEETVRKAVEAFFKRSVGVVLPIAVILMSLYFGYLLLNGNSGWVSAMTGSILAIGLALLASLYFSHYRNLMKRFLAMRVPRASLALHENSLTLSADSGSNEIPSTSIVEVWAYDEFWLVFFSRANFFTIPRLELSADEQASIAAKFSDWGLKVI